MPSSESWTEHMDLTVTSTAATIGTLVHFLFAGTLDHLVRMLCNTKNAYVYNVSLLDIFTYVCLKINHFNVIKTYKPQISLYSGTNYFKEVL